MQLKYRLLSVLAATGLLLTACAENDPMGVEGAPQTRPEAAAPKFAPVPVGQQWHIFTWQQPTEYLDAAPGWEVSTRFKSSKSGRIVGLHFWRAPGETGTNTGRLWTDNGQQLASADFPGGGSGWVYVSLQTPVAIAANTYYRVSVNTNSKQAKWPAGFNNSGAATNGPLYATTSYYGQPMGSAPTSSSGSIFFADVQFEEDVPLPNLYVALIEPRLNDINGNPLLIMRVCNQGPGATKATTMHFIHNKRPLSGGVPAWHSEGYQVTPALGAGACYDHKPIDYSAPGYFHEYHVWVDVDDWEYESNENNYAYGSWSRTF